MGQPRILFIDIETAPIIMAAWTTYEANAVYVLRDTYIISVAYRWQGDRKAKSVSLPDFPRYKKHKHCDKSLCGVIWKRLDEADIVIAHNGDRFDIPKINSRLLVHGHHQPSPYKTVDTLKAARKTFKFDSNKLDNIGRYLGLGRKLPHTGKDLWVGCMNGDPKSLATMRRYNAQDCKLLEAVYHKIAPYHSTHPDLTAYSQEPGCPVCQSTNIQNRGVNVAKTRRTQRLHCQDCGHWFSGATIK